MNQKFSILGLLYSISIYRHPQHTATNCGDKIVALYRVLALCVCVYEPNVAVKGVAFLLLRQQVPGLSLVLETAILSFSWLSSVSSCSLRDSTLKQSKIASFASFPIRYSPSPSQSTL